MATGGHREGEISRVMHLQTDVALTSMHHSPHMLTVMALVLLPGASRSRNVYRYGVKRATPGASGHKPCTLASEALVLHVSDKTVRSRKLHDGSGVAFGAFRPFFAIPAAIFGIPKCTTLCYILRNLDFDSCFFFV